MWVCAPSEMQPPSAFPFGPSPSCPVLGFSSSSFSLSPGYLRENAAIHWRPKPASASTWCNARWWTLPMMAFTSESISKQRHHNFWRPWSSVDEKRVEAPCKGDIRGLEDMTWGTWLGLSAACPHFLAAYMQAKHETSITMALLDPLSGCHQYWMPSRLWYCSQRPSKVYSTFLSSLVSLFCMVIMRSLPLLSYSLPPYQIPPSSYHCKRCI